LNETAAAGGGSREWIMAGTIERKTRAIAARTVQMAAIEKELSAFWREALARPVEAAGPPATRVCTLSLVVYLTDRKRLDSISQVVKEAAETYPLRAVILVAEKQTDKPEIKAEISGYCRLAEGGETQICCEQVVIAARGEAIEALPMSAVPLLMPDLPVVLWWTGQPPFMSKAFERPESISDHVIVDSSEFSSPMEGLRQMIPILTRHRHSSLGDLNWSRLTPWRELTADVFDDPDFRPYLEQIDELRVEYASDTKPNPSQGILYAGWLASRLRWAPRRGMEKSPSSEFEAAADASGREVRVYIRPAAHPSAGRGNLVSARILSGQGAANFVLARPADDRGIQVDAEAAGTPPLRRTARSETRSLSHLIAGELDMFSTDAVYQESLLAGFDLVTHQPGPERLGRTIW